MEKVVVVSDLHLGEEGCSLRDEAIVSSFIEELKAQGEIDQFILLGDILDLSMGGFSKATEDAKPFFEAILGVDIKEILYLPGNHDHHLWVLEAEHRDIIQKIRNGGIPESPNYIREFKGKETFISGIFPDSMKDKLIVKYPNHIAKVKEKRYFFHHGHYLSTEGTLICNIDEALKKCDSLNDFELENSPIHELIQYSLEQAPHMKEKIKEAWKGGGEQLAMFTVIDEMLDSFKKWQYFFSPLIRFFLIINLIKPKPIRGTKIDNKMIERIENYIKLSEETCDCFVFGHTHIPEGKIKNSLIIANAGSWLNEGDGASNSYIVIDDKVTIKKLGIKESIWM
ncbi:MAG: metallophosphoesterase [bacterium]